MLQQSRSPWYVDFANYLVSGLLPPDLKFQQKKKFLHDVRSYQWDDLYLYKLCSDQVILKDILVVIEQLPRFCNQVITSLLFLKMLMSLLNVVTCVKGQET